MRERNPLDHAEQSRRFGRQKEILPVSLEFRGTNEKTHLIFMNVAVSEDLQKSSSLNPSFHMYNEGDFCSRKILGTPHLHGYLEPATLTSIIILFRKET